MLDTTDDTTLQDERVFKTETGHYAFMAMGELGTIGGARAVFDHWFETARKKDASRYKNVHHAFNSLKKASGFADLRRTRITHAPTAETATIWGIFTYRNDDHFDCELFEELPDGTGFVDMGLAMDDDMDLREPYRRFTVHRGNAWSQHLAEELLLCCRATAARQPPEAT